MKLAISGKGGVGKTTICAHLIQALSDMGRRVLAIDADPSPHLGRVLGFPGLDTVIPIAEMKDLLQERSQKNGPFYKLNPKVNDLPERFIIEHNNIKLMVLGSIQEGGSGCACADNAVLRSLLNILLLSKDEDIVLDMEAGVEHLGRGTIATVDFLTVVVQPYRGSIETAEKILRLSDDLHLKDVLFIANNIADDDDIDFIHNSLGVKPVASFPASKDVRMAERQGRAITSSSDDFMAVAKGLISRLLSGDIPR